ncbi:MAG: hypothetical protein A3D44_00965 [Candidatus Staskawiczbacteria bacterium RIFCSPHIGHO2_02_FULL_42_22]|uniref:Uncharacterized protein n=1 Tax=Candidatus Staskawiczbacteria bacterium RIFCSPHIGHO2_02_FULL_42_22 TaxID=1802207 RepID=A0A1G2I3A1_9BACT|nr:MAG: hypothetical protein A3D44_00965 [Candidatus Staskawiczbacteria bacterium RIFCSPHIGHO2_02_FULL_42_22]
MSKPENLNIEHEKIEEERGFNYTWLTPEESETLFKIANEIREKQYRSFVGDVNGVIFVLMAAMDYFEGLSDEDKEKLGPIRDKILKANPRLAKDPYQHHTPNWRFKAVPRTQKDANQFIEKNIMETAGKDPADPGKGTFIASYRAEDYAHAAENTSFVLMAYDIANMRQATQEEAGPSGAYQHRLVPMSGELKDYFLGAIFFEIDAQIPSYETVRDYLGTKKEALTSQALEDYRKSVGDLSKKGIEYAADEGLLVASITGSIDYFTHSIYFEFEKNRPLIMERIKSKDLLERASQWVKSTPSPSIPFSLTGKTIDGLKEALLLPKMILQGVREGCESALKELIQEYNLKKKQSSKI